MKSAGVFVATVLFALIIGAVGGTATAAGETGRTGVLVTSSATNDGDSGWGRFAG
ncbi:hypothetical protein ACFW9I_01625 [[Kitasatospora] papulosa]|uniref:hypothetical protein n=1 Tax=[Kitasatospora] papulosa TaxID=1464011 RepID=UPI0035D5AD68